MLYNSSKSVRISFTVSHVSGLMNEFIVEGSPLSNFFF